MIVHSHPAIVPRPFLKWAGGKSQVLLQYAPHFPKTFKTYYEPFLGGGAVFFHLSPEQAWLADINAELVNVYRCIRDYVEAVIQCLNQHQHCHSVEHYYQTRAHPGECDIERAARLLYLNKTCFNGLYRENSKGQFNVPIGRYKKPTICNPELLRAASYRLRNARIEEKPFETVLDLAVSHDDFVYFDPPYHPISSTSSFTAYNRYSFHAEDQIHLQKVFAKLAGRGVQVMLSNSDCPFIRDLYQDFTIHTIQAARSINSNANRRGKITEVLVTSY
jgi:DNA adenine methylase